MTTRTGGRRLCWRENIILALTAMREQKRAACQKFLLHLDDCREAFETARYPFQQHPAEWHC